MDGLIFLVILVPLGILVLLIILLSKLFSQEQDITATRKMVAQLKDRFTHIENLLKDLANKELSTAGTKEQAEVHAFPKAVKPEVKPPAEVELPPTAFEPPPQVKEEQPAPPPLPEPALSQPEPATASLFDQNIRGERRTDWEKFIGENLANKIGIAVLVLGISFFVKFAIDKNWINETGRVLIGFLSGAVLIGFAHRIRNSYRSFSSVLVGGGLTVFYFTVAFAFHQYHLISQQAAFIIMVVITAFAVILAVLYDRIELGVLATIGGFVTPFLVSTGDDNYVVLFTYLAILNCGLLVLSWFRRWKAVNVIALFFTISIFGEWLVTRLFTGETLPLAGALIFATVFYALFIAMNILSNLKRRTSFGAFDFVLLATINFLYYAAGIACLNRLNEGEYNGLFTAALGAVNFVMAWWFFRKAAVDKNFIFLLIGLTVTFISLTGPVQLKGNQITLFWAAELVMLFWLYQRSRIVLLKVASLLLAFPLMISLFMDWSAVYFTDQQVIPVIANRGFITTLITASAFFIFRFLLRKEQESKYLPGLENVVVRNIATIAGILTAYLAGALEIYFQFSTRLPEAEVYPLYLQLFTFAFILLIQVPFRKAKSFGLMKGIGAAAAVFYYILQIRFNSETSFGMLETGRYQEHFIAHWVSGLLFVVILYRLIAFVRSRSQFRAGYGASLSWIMSVVFLIFISVEGYYLLTWIGYPTDRDWYYWSNLYFKAGLSIAWGISSFCLMWLGMKHKFRPLRVISLSLFTITIAKLFLFDIRNIPPGGKIAAFILLGVLLLVVSFMYQRLKKMIIDESKE